MKKSHIIELQKAYKKYEFLKLAHHVLMWIGVILYFGIIVFNFLNLWVIGHIRFYIGLVTVLFGFPMLIIRKKMKTIDNRIREIESMYERKSLENNTRNTGDGSMC